MAPPCHSLHRIQFPDKRKVRQKKIITYLFRLYRICSLFCWKTSSKHILRGQSPYHNHLCVSSDRKQMDVIWLPKSNGYVYFLPSIATYFCLNRPENHFCIVYSSLDKQHKKRVVYRYYYLGHRIQTIGHRSHFIWRQRKKYKWGYFPV